MKEWYKDDLAYIHDVGYSNYALKSTPGIIEILNQSGIQDGLVVDLGCGSGISAQELTKANYRILGIDISESMIAIARKRVANAEFRVESFFKAEILPCHAVISISECFNYLFDSDTSGEMLVDLFERIYKALVSGGVLIFDIAEPGQIAQGITTKGFNEGDDWIVLVEKNEEQKQGILTRRIITFRKVGEYYRRDHEVHYQQLYEATDIAQKLRKIGFQVEIVRSYGEYNLPKAHAAFIARKSV
ncbi:MAG: class I SAM-dependent methyltransferase [Nostoc sp.]|uniref:class I SAM-dependent methyltransferase n=1 Tax=Nostoc sp. TaxID=1180 RepID=UPI002FF8DD38